jgi:DNA-binding response OmpR family regulator
MVVASIVVTTIIVFIVVDLVLRMLLKRVRDARMIREREHALDIGLKLDVSEQAQSLRRVELDNPKARILAVDDEKIILDSFRKTLVLEGYSIDTVEKGTEVLGLIRKNDYDFVFTDLKMPGMDGVEVTKAVKHLRPDIDVIVITGYASIETAVETVKFGATDYVQKPFTEDELLDFVKTALIRRQDSLEKQMRHKIRLIKPGTRESKSKFELNVPAGVFISPQHAWAKIELNGTVRVGLDDLMRKVFKRIDHVELPEAEQKIEKGEPLFSVKYGDHVLKIPSPLSGKITSVNAEHVEHPEWLAIKPFELSWMCGIEPSNLAGELPDLRIGKDSIDWYQKEIDRYYELSNEFMVDSSQDESNETGESEQNRSAEYLKLLVGFSEPFLQVENSD